MVQKWHIQLYGVSSGTSSPCRSIHQHCKVRLNHVLRRRVKTTRENLFFFIRTFVCQRFGLRQILFSFWVAVFASFAGKHCYLKIYRAWKRKS